MHNWVFMDFKEQSLLASSFLNNPALLSPGTFLNDPASRVQI